MITVTIIKVVFWIVLNCVSMVYEMVRALIGSGTGKLGKNRRCIKRFFPIEQG